MNEETEEKRVHDMKCVRCAKLFECAGHPADTTDCVCFEERKDEE